MSCTITEGDVKYLAFYLMDYDPITGSLSYHDLSGADSIVFRMRKYRASSNAIDTTASIVNASLGYCRVLVTVPVAGTYETELEVFEGTLHDTWVGPVYYVREPLG